jgi:hypothetical protein
VPSAGSGVADGWVPQPAMAAAQTPMTSSTVRARTSAMIAPSDPTHAALMDIVLPTGCSRDGRVGGDGLRWLVDLATLDVAGSRNVSDAPMLHIARAVSVRAQARRGPVTRRTPAGVRT